MRRTAAAWLIAVCAAIPGCDRGALARSADGHAGRSDSAVLTIDSILPTGEALRRFQAKLSPVVGYSGGAESQPRLIARFVSAMESGDSAALEGMVVSKAEYGFLYFPGSLYSRKPYELPPDIAWLLSEQNSRKGLTRLTRRLAGKPLGFRGYECTEPFVEGDNRFWRTCQLSYIDPETGRAVKRQLFGAIIERADGYKFLSYANDF